MCTVPLCTKCVILLTVHVIVHAYHNFEHSVQLYIKFTHGKLRSFVARQFLLVIYALLSVIFAMSHVRECERMKIWGMVRG